MEKPPTSAGSDAGEIRRHVVSLFDAFLTKDRTTLRNGRLSDWKGFQIQSTSLIRGVDEYMSELDEVLDSLRVSSYEFLEFDVDVFDDLALVFYVARDWLETDTDHDLRSSGSQRTVLIRALDVYRRVEGGWVQAASNICSIADDRA